jgi:heptosyltransferase-2
MRSSKPVFLKYFDAVKSLGISYDEKGTEIFTPPESRLKVISLLSEAGIDQSDPLFVLCPGASFSNKQWLPERFAELAGLIMKEKLGQVVFLGGPGDKVICDSIISLTSEKILNLAGNLTLLESAALAHMATAVVSNDSGMLHLAQSQGTPVIAIFGPTSRELGFFPLPAKSMVVEHKVSCRPCTTKGLNHCPKGHFQCMKGIEAAKVFEALMNIVKKSAGL